MGRAQGGGYGRVKEERTKEKKRRRKGV